MKSASKDGVVLLVVILFICIITWPLYSLEKRDVERTQATQDAVVEFVEAFTGEETELLYRESDSGFYVVEANKALYKVKVDREHNEVEHVLFQDKFVYEK